MQRPFVPASGSVRCYDSGVISRRRLLATGAAGLALGAARQARAIGPRSRFRLGHVRTADGNWKPRDNALRRVLWETDKRTSIEVDLEPVEVSLASPTLHETPFLYLAGDREFSMPTTAEIRNLRRFLTYGGFLLIDSAEGRVDGAFDRSARRLMEAVFPRPSPGLQVIPRDHTVYKSFYLVDRPVGRLALSGAMEGIIHDDRVAALYSVNDLGGAWARDNLGSFSMQCEPGGERQREMAYRLGINIMMYALCLDYKADQVHVPFIMRRRRWRPSE